MEVRINEKGRSVYATKDYQQWDIIHSEEPIFSMSGIMKPEYKAIAQNSKGKSSFAERLSSFILTAPDVKISNQHPHLKFPLIFLKHRKDITKASDLAKTPKTEFTEKQLKNIAKAYQVDKDDLRTLIQITQANGFAIPGLFSPQIGLILFKTGSMFNHCCNPNAFALITYNRMIVYAKRPIKAEEEITFSYKPLCLPEIKSVLEFDCECGFCQDKVPGVSQKVYDQFNKVQSYQSRIDNLYTTIANTPTWPYMQLLIEAYYEPWILNQIYREDELFELIKKMEPTVDDTWLECQLLGLAIAQRKGRQEDSVMFANILKPFLNSDIKEHIIVCACLMPHIYHNILKHWLLK